MADREVDKRVTRADVGRSLLLLAAAVFAVVLLWALRSIVVVVAFALLLAYALDPLVSWLTRRTLPRGAKIQRPAAASAVILILVGIVAYGFATFTPRLVEQGVSLVSSLPASVDTLLAQTRSWAQTREFGHQADPAIDQFEKQLRASVPQLGTWLVSWLGRLFGNVFQMLGFFVLPLLAFYLLAEREEVRASLMRFLPQEAHPRMAAMGRAVDRALASYVRGQAIVCLFSGVVTGTLLAIIGFPHALLLGLVVGLAEVLPVLGFWMAAIGIALDGLGVSTRHALLGFGAYALVNGLTSLFVTPRVMGRHLKMHPFVVIVSVLAGAELLGPAGVLLALPAAAVAQALMEEIAQRRARLAAGARERGAA
jgi:predicted PurR-regulated permease PerM